MTFANPFPGMNPWLEHPTLWPDLHARLITAMADELAAKVGERYFVRVESQTYVISNWAGETRHGRPDISILREAASPYHLTRTGQLADRSGAQVLEIELEPEPEEVNIRYLTVRSYESRDLISVIEVLSPANKRGEGRVAYLEKRAQLLTSKTNLVEIDLLRGGDPLHPKPVDADYSILISRAVDRPKGEVVAFSMQMALPSIPVPLMRGEEEPVLALNGLFQALFERARYGPQIDYNRDPVPPLSAEQAGWFNKR